MQEESAYNQWPECLAGYRADYCLLVRMRSFAAILPQEKLWRLRLP